MELKLDNLGSWTSKSSNSHMCMQKFAWEYKVSEAAQITKIKYPASMARLQEIQLAYLHVGVNLEM